MSLAQVNGRAHPRASYRADLAARTMQDRLTGTFYALAFTSALLAVVTVSGNDIQASAAEVRERIWQTVSTVVCGRHMDAISLVGPSCGKTAS